MPGDAYSKTLTLEELGYANLVSDPAQLDWAPALKACGVALRASVLENFQGAHDPDGRPWAALRFPRPRGGDKPLNDTGLLRSSMTGVANVETNIEREPGAVRFSFLFGSHDERAATHQYGATIVPKRAKALTIPLTVEAVRAGRPRRFTPGVLFVYRSPSGKGFLAEQKGKGKRTKLILHYIFVMKVVIPARPMVGWNDALLEDIGEIVGDYAEKNA
jgi:phage gpG-like protein